MRRHPRIMVCYFLIFLFFLAPMTSLAENGGAWILWDQSDVSSQDEPHSRHWIIIDAFSNQQDCKDSMAPEIKRNVEAFRNMAADENYKYDLTLHDNGYHFIRLDPPFKIQYVNLYCFPSSLDPRPQKGNSWIVWQQTSLVNSRSHWLVSEGLPTFQQCVEQARNTSRILFDRLKKKGFRVSKGRKNNIFADMENKKTTYNHICLPNGNGSTRKKIKKTIDQLTDAEYRVRLVFLPIRKRVRGQI